MDVVIDGTKARITQHAIDRYRDRVHQAGTRTAASAQLVAVATAVGTWSDTAPAWVSTVEAARADRWLLLGDDVALPCCGRSLCTVLVLGGKAASQDREKRRKRGVARHQRMQRRARQQRRGRVLVV